MRPVRLQVQYRMHPCLSEFPSNTFYEGSLQNGVLVSERERHELSLPFPDASQPMMFLTCNALEEMSSSGTSYLNRGEAASVERLVTAMLRAGLRASQIGVITPYEGQRTHMQVYFDTQASLASERYEGLEIASVDSFQGREKDYIILSCVRSNEKQGIGFLADPRRLNVALTRARFGLVVVGNTRVLAKQQLWHNLLHHFQEK